VKTLPIAKAKERLAELLIEAASEHQPVIIKGKGVSGVLLDEEDWRAIQETLYLLSVPGMRESIREGMATPADECSEELDW
jgi:prevent-host-death family protein